MGQALPCGWKPHGSPSAQQLRAVGNRTSGGHPVFVGAVCNRTHLRPYSSYMRFPTAPTVDTVFARTDLRPYSSEASHGALPLGGAFALKNASGHSDSPKSIGR